MDWSLHILEKPEQMTGIEELQRKVWPGCETDVVPVHILLATVHNGGLLIAAYPVNENALLGSIPLGFVFGFPGIYPTPDGPRLKHCSHMLGVHPDYRNLGLGYALKRAQWQMVRRQGVDRITWTYDPLLSVNAHLNICRLGAVCNTYLPDFYGVMRDQLNVNLPSDRFQVDWWVNSRRVNNRLNRRPRSILTLNHFSSAKIPILNPLLLNQDNFSVPLPDPTLLGKQSDVMLLVEVPTNFSDIKNASPELARQWRLKTRDLFLRLFAQGYLITDFIYQSGEQLNSYYVLSYGEATL